MKVLCVGDSDMIGAWVFHRFQIILIGIDLAVAVVEHDQIIGVCIFQAHNGPDVELSYYGPKTLTLDIVKGLAKIAVDHLGVCRITARTAKSNKMMTRGIKKIGFEYEGIRHHAYGDKDAVMYGLYGKKL